MECVLIVLQLHKQFRIRVPSSKQYKAQATIRVLQMKFDGRGEEH